MRDDRSTTVWPELYAWRVEALTVSVYTSFEALPAIVWAPTVLESLIVLMTMLWQYDLEGMQHGLPSRTGQCSLVQLWWSYTYCVVPPRTGPDLKPISHLQLCYDILLTLSLCTLL